MSKEYTISLDIGTAAVGWAVMNDDFTLAKGNKKITTEAGIKKSRTNLWGVRLFEQGQVAEEARLKRGNRRRLTRRKKRLNFLREIFEEHIHSFDDSFFIRMDESFFQDKDLANKTVETSYPFFNGKLGSGETFSNEVEYYNKYPTIYHLRHRLMTDKTQADLRLVYLALHHILKYRGHFVNQGQVFNLENINVSHSLKRLLMAYNNDEVTTFSFKYDSLDEADKILKNRTYSKSKKAFELTKIFTTRTDENYAKYDQGTRPKTEKVLKDANAQQAALFTAIVGNSIDLAKIFNNLEYSKKENEEMPKGADFKYGMDAKDFDATLATLEKNLTPGEMEVILLGKAVYEAITLCNILTAESLSASMIAKFKNHKEQLAELKSYAKTVSGNFYNGLFAGGGAYTRYIEGEKGKSVSRGAFYKELEKVLEVTGQGKNKVSVAHSEFYERIKSDLEFETYLPKQRMSDNGAIPYQIHESELIKIIENQKAFYPFLGEMVEIKSEGEDGTESLKKEYKIQTLMKFRIPYYVGPLAMKEGHSRFAWMTRNEGYENTKITPWNFHVVVNKDISAVKFIERMTSSCTYLPEEKVLPKNSLIYQQFTIYNELINSGWTEGGKKKYFAPELREKIVDKLFKKHKKVSAKLMVRFLESEGYVSDLSPRALFGIDTLVKSPSYNTTYSSYFNLTNGVKIDVQTIEDNLSVFEQVIKWQTIFDDKAILKKTIRIANETQWDSLLTPEEINRLSEMKYTGWGRLSEKLLTGIKHSNGKTILENLRTGTYNNLMRLLEDDKIQATIKDAQLDRHETGTLNYGLVKDLSGSPALKKGIWQSLKIVSELECYLGRENISKIVVEMARGTSGGRTITRKNKIKKFYNTFTQKTDQQLPSSLKIECENQKDKAFDNERLYLYFLQNGKCLYSGDALEIDQLSSYEVDHIIPKSYLKDDSFDNKALVKRVFNQNKADLPPSETIINKMSDYWELLAKNGQISPRKLSHLKKGKLDDKTKEGFINRQLVETRQISKHVANILADHFVGTSTVVLTPKAGLTSQFRRDFDFKKIRDINDHHHAHDAYLTGVVANYIYQARPDLRNLWVYGEYQRQTKDAFKGNTQRREDDFLKQLLSGMEEDSWFNYLTGEIFAEKNTVLSNVAKTLNYRNVNLVKKTERQTGKFGDESICKKDKKKIPVKRHLDPEIYGGHAGAISAFAVLNRDKKGNIKPKTVSAMEASLYKKQDGDIIVSKYTKYKLPSGVYRLMASYQEAQSANQMKTIKLPNFDSTNEAFEVAYDALADFIEKNKLFAESNIPLLKDKIKDYFMDVDSEIKMKVLTEMLRVTKGSNRNLIALKQAGLGTDAQRLKGVGNLITNDTTLIYQSVTGLFETRKTLT